MVTTAVEGLSHLADRFGEADPLDIAALASLSPALVVAPHPDDESLGCGGLLALLGDAGVDVHPVLVTDGAASHPNSRRFDAEARRALRDAEWRHALSCLGLGNAQPHRLGWPDGDVPVASDPRFASATAALRTLLDQIDPELVLLPWRRDPHPDHRASHALVRAALRGRTPAPRCLEYVVWTEDRGVAGDMPRAGEARCWSLDISAALGRKCLAIAAHRSQHGYVITDDPGGFVISAEMRRRSERPREYFFEASGGT